MRKRFQKGTLKKRNGSWIGQWRDQGHCKNLVLGKVREMTKTDALTKLADILRPINSRETTTFDYRTTLEDFLNAVYFPVNRRRWKESTRSTNEPRIDFHIC